MPPGMPRARAREWRRIRPRPLAVRSMPLAAIRTCLASPAGRRPSRSRPDHSLDKIAHLLELRIGLTTIDAGRNHDIAFIILERTLEDDVIAGSELRLDVVSLLAGRIRDLGPIGSDLDQAFLQAATIEIRAGLATGEHPRETRVEPLPVPLRAGEMRLRRQRRCVDVVARDH